ncbi:Crp/Fnr family transcriptional regulator [Siphonobacter sp. SORGH_AS_0500]|uniref:Crp/Fnr family transcriptional regulator n=1 Tax=Siphonobacter sp. SORGH_AS_0500 TaxID=1864824 RepID=UPI002862A942|nr:Crp/Fnr family transcriptional regulator [Siphonobacter sp. SORGH_AS_0500]MDR6197561.1 CRP-like cAMP-binding protein [Siphonobacter sp. SORGH_AS_0500]
MRQTSANFEQYIRSFEQLQDLEIEKITASSSLLQLRRHQLLLREGDICRHKIFVLKGLLRMYRVRADGTESTMRFAAENNWIIDHESYMSQQSSHYRIEALEDSKVLIWTRETMEELFEAMPVFRSFSDRLREKSMNDSVQRIYMNLSYTAEEKYEDFMKTHPEIFRRIPLHLVATYLGVSRETLSRIRHKQHRNK